jgi:hypothetical protein
VSDRPFETRSMLHRTDPSVNRGRVLSRQGGRISRDRIGDEALVRAGPAEPRLTLGSVAPVSTAVASTSSSASEITVRAERSPARGPRSGPSACPSFLPSFTADPAPDTRDPALPRLIAGSVRRARCMGTHQDLPIATWALPPATSGAVLRASDGLRCAADELDRHQVAAVAERFEQPMGVVIGAGAGELGGVDPAPDDGACRSRGRSRQAHLQRARASRIAPGPEEPAPSRLLRPAAAWGRGNRPRRPGAGHTLERRPFDDR